VPDESRVSEPGHVEPPFVGTVNSIGQLIRDHGWTLVLAVLFMGLYFGWLPDPRRYEIAKMAADTIAETIELRSAVRRLGERQARTMIMLTELCLAMQRHDQKSTGSCAYIYQNHDGGSPGVP
jgi:hypothetical protein